MRRYNPRGPGISVIRFGPGSFLLELPLDLTIPLSFCRNSAGSTQYGKSSSPPTRAEESLHERRLPPVPVVLQP
jgi:hypothetical protein